MQLKQFIPQEFCLKCDVCCRFHDAHSIWIPLFSEEEVSYLTGHDILPPAVFTTSDTVRNCGQHINAQQYKDYFICPCLNPLDSKCKIYKDRPFECQLYPFLLIRIGSQFYLAQDKKCPYLSIEKQDKIKTHTDYLKREFKKKNTISFLRQNRGLFTEYPPADLKLLFSIEI